MQPVERMLQATSWKGSAMSTNEALSTDQASIKILRLPQVCNVTGFCRSMIYLMEAERRFPQRVRIGTRAVGWLEGEVQAWLLRQIEASRTRVM